MPSKYNTYPTHKLEKMLNSRQPGVVREGDINMLRELARRKKEKSGRKYKRPTQQYKRGTPRV